MVESSLDKWHDDDLSIVASDEEGSSHDGQLNGHGPGEEKSPRTAPIDLVRKETKAVSYLRYLILLSLLVTAVLLCLGTFIWVEKAEELDWLQSNPSGATSASCALNAEAMQEAFVHGLEQSLLQTRKSHLMAAFSLSASFTSFARSASVDASTGWPFVNIPDFGPRLTGVLQSTGATQAQMAPLVSGNQRNAFEDFAVNQQLDACSTCPAVGFVYNVDARPLERNEITSPVWQVAPFSQEPIILKNQFSVADQSAALKQMQTSLSGVWSDLSFTNSETDPSLLLVYPVFEDFNRANLVGSVSLAFQWERLLQDAVKFDGMMDWTAFVESCSERVASYDISQGNVTFVERLVTSIPQTLKTESLLIELPGSHAYGDFVTGTSGGCATKIWLAPSSVVDGFFNDGTTPGQEGPDSNRHVVLTGVVAAVFAFILLTFLVYDWLVEKRQSVVVNIATKSSAIVENLFPAQVRDRMLQNMQQQATKGAASVDTLNDAGISPGINEAMANTSAPNPTAMQAPNPVSIKQFLTNESSAGTNVLSTPPIADLFPNTTVLFADIAGFTAWSSQREPPQVFTLLETLYRSFDVIAGKLKVFKVETIGDCYMAVTGLPNPDESHAVHMSRFAYQCLIGMKELILELEAILGPGTSDLALRVGLHSGAVTAGVLRGEKSRFQLFGDTVNTASRMESTGMRGKIQISQETADLLMAAGKSHWLKPRDETIVAKGKGELKTYWLDPTKKRRTTKNGKEIRLGPDMSLSNGGYVDKPMSSSDIPFDDKYARLIDWNVDVLLHHLARVISCRSRSPARGSLVNHSTEVSLLPAAINDVAEVVALPPFDPDASKFRTARPDVSMLQQTRADLHEYVKQIALMYHDVPFHNFEHASHVTLCANKLLNRLINSDEYETEEELHNATFGISSDPLTHFAIVFAALVHDADHLGVPNAQLIKDKHELASKFHNRSIAEQNSVHLGWEMLMDKRFERLRKCIYQTNVERKRFRQLVINSVLATDIADRAVNEDRQRKWDKAFRSSDVGDVSALQAQEDMNRKATVVIEHIIQVSDVAHTMQHWHIYRRWNERLFHEMHEAFESGKVVVDPSANWYVGELGFFDYYLIPLAMKLKECGVFGASGYEYISYVLKNKKEWERKGRQVVQEMVVLYKDVEEEEQEDDEDDDEDYSGSSFDSEYDSDDLTYDSPGDISTDSSEDEAQGTVDSMTVQEELR